jgi:succinoglycan biosynthesis transport protein ExoP
MAEELDEQPGQQFDIERYLDIARRRHVLFLTLLLLGWGTVWGASWLLPPRYKSSTLILVQPPSMPKNYVLPNVSDDLQDQIQSITQQITSRTRLLMIIDKLGLYRDKRHLLTPDQKVIGMRSDIDIDLVRDTGSNAINAFRVSYTAPDPHIAQQVTSELTDLFINENLSVRQQQSQDTTQFLQGQLDSARLNLAEQDAKVRAFQTAHEGSLPTQEASNLQILSGLQSQMQSGQDALNTARQQRVYHQSMIDQYRALESGSRTVAGASTGPASATGLAAIDQRLETLRSKLADLSTRYTDRFPEVEEVKTEIARTEKTREQVIASLEQAGKAKAKNPVKPAPVITDPSLDAPLLQLQGQLKSDEMEISNDEQAISSLRSRINEYQARLNDEPAVAQQLADLTRGYQQSQTNYNDLLKKVSDSQMATNMEQLQEGERFTIIDPPSLPLKPDFPNRMKMCGAGIGVGMGLGVLVVGLLEFLDDRLHNDKEIEKLLTAPVICEIPEILSAADENHARRRMFLGWTMAVTVMMVILAGAAITYLKA